MNRTAKNVTRSPEEIAEAPLPELSLAEVLDEAVAWQPEAEAVISLCLPAGGKRQDLARRTGQVATVYRRLREANRRLPHTVAQQEADSLLNFHEQIVEQALLLGFRPDSEARERVAAHFVGGLADPGQRLCRLRDEIRAQR
jgi:hypothetical protein